MSGGRRPARVDRPIVLMGPMAVGKSHLGGFMHRTYGYRTLDSDKEIVARHGPIPQIFAEHGEPEFRRLEAQTIAELLCAPEAPGRILSLGGGAPMIPAVQELLQDAYTVYLAADLETVRPRLRRSGSRPMLDGDPVARWVRLLHEREPTFRRLADLQLSTIGRPIHEIAASLHRALLRQERR